MKRSYIKITNEKRKALIDVVFEKGLKIKQAALLLDIPYENAKAIFRVYRNEERTEKCKHRARGSFCQETPGKETEKAQGDQIDSDTAVIPKAVPKLVGTKRTYLQVTPIKEHETHQYNPEEVPGPQADSLISERKVLNLNGLKPMQQLNYATAMPQMPSAQPETSSKAMDEQKFQRAPTISMPCPDFDILQDEFMLGLSSPQPMAQRQPLKPFQIERPNFDAPQLRRRSSSDFCALEVDRQFHIGPLNANPFPSLTSIPTVDPLRKNNSMFSHELELNGPTIRPVNENESLVQKFQQMEQASLFDKHDDDDNESSVSCSLKSRMSCQSLELLLEDQDKVPTRANSKPNGLGQMNQLQREDNIRKMMTSDQDTVRLRLPLLNDQRVEHNSSVNIIGTYPRLGSSQLPYTQHDICSKLFDLAA